MSSDDYDVARVCKCLGNEHRLHREAGDQIAGDPRAAIPVNRGEERTTMPDHEPASNCQLVQRSLHWSLPLRARRDTTSRGDHDRRTRSIEILVGWTQSPGPG
jgi:hypothetical protein